MYSLYLLFVGLIVLAAVLMCFVVLIQNSKGGGLSSSFAASNQIMGVRKTTDFIEKLTWGLAIFMVVVSVATAYVIPTTSEASSVIMDQAVKEQKTNPLNAPAGFAAPQSDAATDQPAAVLQLKILLLINKKDILQNERPSKKGRFFIVYKN